MSKRNGRVVSGFLGGKIFPINPFQSKALPSMSTAMGTNIDGESCSLAGVKYTMDLVSGVVYVTVPTRSQHYLTPPHQPPNMPSSSYPTIKL